MKDRNFEAELLDEGLKVLAQELECGPNFYEIREKIAKLKAVSTKPELLTKVDKFSEHVGEQKAKRLNMKLHFHHSSWRWLYLSFRSWQPFRRFGHGGWIFLSLPWLWRFRNFDRPSERNRAVANKAN